MRWPFRTGIRRNLADPPHVVFCQADDCLQRLEVRLGWKPTKVVGLTVPTLWPSGPPILRERVEVCPRCGAEQDTDDQRLEAIARYWYRSEDGLSLTHHPEDRSF